MSDIKLLDRTFKFRPICLWNMRISNVLLKKSAWAGLTLAQIISIMCSDPYDEDENARSPLEDMVTKAENMYITIWVGSTPPWSESWKDKRILKRDNSEEQEEVKEVSKSVSPPFTPFKSNYQMVQ